MQTKLDAPNRAYQAYLTELDTWSKKRSLLIGDENSPESKLGIETAIKNHEKLPAELEALKLKQAKLAIDIHVEKVAQAGVYSTLYGPVQEFINTHDLAKNRLKLAFRVELVSEGFTDKLLSFLSQNRRGSFMGVEPGQARASALVNETRWDDWDSVAKFLEQIDYALHNDVRSSPVTPVSVSEQLIKGLKAEEVYNFLYQLDYVRPKYILQWEGKDLSMLSPGERGTLLLVFYLLIDKGDSPLIIDQPEGNLDNHTVTKILVDCIKEARNRRQIFIVTHNPNLAVVCDADQVIHANMDIGHGNTVTYSSGALENPEISRYVTDVLEGTRPAFNLRGDKYDVGEL